MHVELYTYLQKYIPIFYSHTVFEQVREETDDWMDVDVNVDVETERVRAPGTALTTE